MQTIMLIIISAGIWLAACAVTVIAWHAFVTMDGRGDR